MGGWYDEHNLHFFRIIIKDGGEEASRGHLRQLLLTNNQMDQIVVLVQEIERSY